MDWFSGELRGHVIAINELTLRTVVNE